MKSENGMGYIKVAIWTIIIAVFVAGGIYFMRMQLEHARAKTIKTNMLLVEWKIKEYEEKQKVAKQDLVCIGMKVSDMQNDPEVKRLIDNGIIGSENYEKYYVLNDEDLQKLDLGISNEEGSYYVVNYETNDILITRGCKYSKNKILYRLSDIEAEQ